MQAWLTWTALAYNYLGRSLSLHWIWRITLLDNIILVGSYFFSELEIDYPCFPGFQSFCWEVWGDTYCFTIVCKLAFSLAVFNIISFFYSLAILIIILAGRFFWVTSIGVLNVSCTWESLYPSQDFCYNFIK
jgi:hypothetical protein